MEIAGIVAFINPLQTQPLKVALIVVALLIVASAAYSTIRRKSA